MNGPSPKPFVPPAFVVVVVVVVVVVCVQSPMSDKSFSGGELSPQVDLTLTLRNDHQLLITLHDTHTWIVCIT